jgi:hypothetical protein
MSVEGIVVGLIALLVGLAFCFAGFRFFLVLLPIWAFVVGFQGGAQLTAFIFGTGFLGDVLGILAGLVVGLVFAVLSYLWFGFAIAALTFLWGYGFASGVLAGVGGRFDLIPIAAGVTLGLILAIGAIAFNAPKWLVVGLTGLGGAALIVAGGLVAVGWAPLADLQNGYVGAIVRQNVIWIGVTIGLAIAGIIAQSATTVSRTSVDASAYRY